MDTLCDQTPWLTVIAMFSPLAYPTGLLMYDLSTTVPSRAHLALTPFEIYHEPLVVIALADGKDDFRKPSNLEKDELGFTGGKRLNDEENFDQYLETVLEIKSQHPTALVHQVFLFDIDTPYASIPSFLVPIHSAAASKATKMKTVMCDLTSILLAEMTSYAKSLQALPTIETPKLGNSGDTSEDYFQPTPQVNVADRQSRPSSAQGTHPSTPAGGLERSLNRQSMPTQAFSSGKPSPDPENRSMSPSNSIPIPPITFDEINGVSGSTSAVAERDKIRPSSRDRISIYGSAVAHQSEPARMKARGRIAIITGSMYLLAGRWPDAVRELADGISLTRLQSDHVWQAKGLENMMVCLLMFGWAGMDFEIPQICYPVGDKASSILNKTSKNSNSNSTPDLRPRSPNVVNRLVSLQNLASLLPGLVNTVLGLYVRAATFTSDQIPQLAFSECIIRFSKLLAITHNSHGILNDQALQRIVLNDIRTRDQDTIPAQHVSFPTRLEISYIAFRALPSTPLNAYLATPDHISILLGLASVLSELGFHRKKVFVLKELMNTFLPVIVQNRKDIAAEMGVHPAASLSSYDNVDLGIGLGGSIEPGIQSFLAAIGQIYGVVSPQPTEKLELVWQDARTEKRGSKPEIPESESPEVNISRILYQATLRSFGSRKLKLDILRASINICEALPDLGGVLRFSSNILRTAGTGVAPGIEDDDGAPSLPVEDQLRIANSISRTASTMTHLGVQIEEAEYWDEFIVREVEITSMRTDRAPIRHARRELQTTLEGQTTQDDGPFLYNPFAATSKSMRKEPILVAGEEAEFKITLQNLYEFDVEVEWLRLETSEDVIDSKTQGTRIGPYRTQTMHFLGSPRVPGSYTITGCSIKIKGCRPRLFAIYNLPWTAKESIKLKQIGLSAASLQGTTGGTKASEAEKAPSVSHVKGPVAQTVSFQVIDLQPELLLRSTSLPQSAIMLLEGEKRIHTITFHNSSSKMPVDFLLVTLDDSSANARQSANSRKNVSPAELYNTEMLSSQLAVRWLRSVKDKEVHIGTNANYTIDIELLGQPGLGKCRILVDYGYVGVQTESLKDYFYTKQIIIPLTLSVNISAELVYNDLLPFTADFAWVNQQKPLQSTVSSPREQLRSQLSSPASKEEKSFYSLLQRLGVRDYGDDHCLIVLDVHNTWLNPLLLSIQVRQNLNHSKDQTHDDQWQRAYTVHETIQPTHTSRLVLLLPRIHITNTYAPIPSLNPSSKRQYVVSAGTIAPHLERSSREGFWYREEVLKHIRASWTEESTDRRGSMDLRSGLNLTRRMIDALKVEDVGVDMKILPCPSENGDGAQSSTIHQIGRSAFTVTTDTFLILKIQITNRLPNPVHPLLRLQPSLRDQPHTVALDLTKKFAWNGLLQRVLPLMQGGEVRTVDLGCCFLCSGEFEISACVEEVRIWKPDDEKGESEGKAARARAATADLMAQGELQNIASSSERRTWFAREPCRVTVRDKVDAM